MQERFSLIYTHRSIRLVFAGLVCLGMLVSIGSIGVSGTLGLGVDSSEAQVAVLPLSPFAVSQNAVGTYESNIFMDYRLPVVGSEHQLSALMMSRGSVSNEPDSATLGLSFALSSVLIFLTLLAGFNALKRPDRTALLPLTVG